MDYNQTIAALLTIKDNQIVENLSRWNSLLCEAQQLTEELERILDPAVIEYLKHDILVGYLKNDIHRLRGRLIQLCPSHLQQKWQK